MSPEVAMEEYINLLSEKFPNWMQNDAVVSSLILLVPFMSSSSSLQEFQFLEGFVLFFCWCFLGQVEEEEEEVCKDAETFWKLICNLRTVIEQQTKRKLTETGTISASLTTFCCPLSVFILCKIGPAFGIDCTKQEKAVRQICFLNWCLVRRLKESRGHEGD